MNEPRLAEFARRICAEMQLEVEGIQDIAEECGVLVPVEVSEPCGESCVCAVWDDPPWTCYRLHPSLNERT